MTAAECLAAQIADPETQWSLGTFGAIAEFSRDPDEPAELRPHSATTDRGGIRLDLPDDMRLFAFEVVTRESWSPRVVICRPRAASSMGRRSAVTEIGPDRQALRLQDRKAILFAVGIDAWQVDACVRVSDPELIARFRAHCGKATFAPGNPAGHAATEPIPDGFVPCAHFYPTHPAKDWQGQSRPFDARRQASFEALLRQFGDQQLVALKERVRDAVAEERAPSTVPVAGRFARSAIRVALRQLCASDGQPPSLSVWLATYDRMASEDSDDEPHLHHR
jgi:hypothetical protein